MKYVKTILPGIEKDPSKISIWNHCLNFLSKDEASKLTVALMDLNIEYVSDYLDWGRGSNDVSDNGNEIAFEIGHRQETCSGSDVTFILGRLHESLGEFQI